MKKVDVIEKLTEMGIEHDPNAKAKDLEALLSEEATIVDVPVAEAPKEELDPTAKNFADRSFDPSVGDRSVEVKPGQMKKVVTDREIAELNKAGKTCGYDPETKEAVFWK